MGFADELEKNDPMTIEAVYAKGSWLEVLNSARHTVRKEETGNEPSDSWKKRILRAEHSPIRRMMFHWKWINLPYWVSVHFVRHHEGITHFVTSSRTDRTGIAREKLPQDNPVDHECEANLQALLNISGERLCMQASTETRAAWKLVKEAIREIDPIVASMMVPKCVSKGGKCPEMNCCKWCYTSECEREVKVYWSNNVPERKDT